MLWRTDIKDISFCPWSAVNIIYSQSGTSIESQAVCAGSGHLCPSQGQPWVVTPGWWCSMYHLCISRVFLLQYSCLENSMDRGAWWAIVYGVIRVRHNLTTKSPPPLPGCSDVQTLRTSVSAHDQRWILFIPSPSPSHPSITREENHIWERHSAVCCT